MNGFNQRVYEIVKQIPSGCVLSYGHIAALAGNHRASRAVGYAMNGCNDPCVPCHRVVFKDGSLSRAFIVKGVNRQYVLLKAEKVSFTKDRRVKMEKHLWQAANPELEAFLKYG